MIETYLREQALCLIKALVDEQVVNSQDLARFVTDTGDRTDPEYLRREMERWYRTLGIEAVINREFTLKKPYFTREEIIKAYERNEILLCVPAGITRQQLGTLFNLASWALNDELVTNTSEIEDVWFKTSCSLLPEYLDKTGLETQRLFQKEGTLGMSLERYMTFVARMRYLTGKTPDVNYWTWLTRGRYLKKSLLIAGFDSNLKFSVHGWLPQFHGSHCGARDISIPNHLYL